MTPGCTPPAWKGHLVSGLIVATATTGRGRSGIAAAGGGSGARVRRTAGSSCTVGSDLAVDALQRSQLVLIRCATGPIACFTAP